MSYVSTLRDRLQDMATGLVETLPSLAIALVILFVTWIVARFATRIADTLVGRSDIRSSLKALIDTLVKLAIWFIGVLIAAIVAIPDLTLASLLAGLGIAAVAIGFAFRDIIENFLSGMLIMVRDKMRIGDVIACEGIKGKVEQITLRETHVRKPSGELTLVPNALLFKNPVEILTDDEVRRHEIIVGVAYDTDLDHAAAVIGRAVERADSVLASKGIDVYARAFGERSVDFVVRWWASSTPRAELESRDKVIRAIKAALDDVGIEIPSTSYVTTALSDTVPASQPIRRAGRGG